MNISQVVNALKNDQPVVVGDTTFEPRGVDAVTLETGETVYWAAKGNGMWLSVDPESEEVILFEDIDEELEPEDDTVVYGGEDYEFSYEGTATMKTDEGEECRYSFREYESSDGDIIRLTENETNGEIRTSVGAKLTEDDLQEA